MTRQRGIGRRVTAIGILRRVSTRSAYLDAPDAAGVRPPRRRRRAATRTPPSRVRAGGRRWATGTWRPTCTPPPTAWRWSSTTPTLTRLTGRPGRIATLRWADLATVRVGGAAAVPRLDEVLDAWPQVRFNIDVKADGGSRPDGRGGRAGRRRRPGAAGLVQRRAGWPGCARWPARRWRPRWGCAAWPGCGWRRWPAGGCGCRPRWWPRRCRCGTGGCGWSTGGSSRTPTASGCRCTSGRSTTLPRWTTYLILAWMAS